jgi:hypothetical protein
VDAILSEVVVVGARGDVGTSAAADAINDGRKRRENFPEIHPRCCPPDVIVICKVANNKTK